MDLYETAKEEEPLKGFTPNFGGLSYGSLNIWIVRALSLFYIEKAN
jgi:hypothetical protein